MAGYPWPVFDPYGPEYRAKIRAALRELVAEANINLIDLFIPIPFTLAHPGQAPRRDQPLEEWANLNYLKNLALFVDDCHEAGLSVELDLADNRWIPYSLDSEHHLGQPGSVWPVASDTPWEESATWFREVIEAVESQAQHPESIALWCMMGHFQHGTAEPDLWGNDQQPAIGANTEKFVKHVWPVFRAAGKRPKGSPIMVPIFAKGGYWESRSPDQRLAAFVHLKHWLVDDLKSPPDYWLMTTYPFCDPAPDGFCYLRRIVEILGAENAARLISTDLKGPGHQHEITSTILTTGEHAGAELLQWHFQKCTEYGLAGWWIYAYQDQKSTHEQTGIRDADGHWKPDLLPVVRHASR